MRLTAIILLFGLTACSDFIDENHYSVFPEAEPYVRSFFREAEKRHFYFDQSILSIEFKKMDHYAGLSMNGNSIYIDTTSQAWHRDPEALIFHEMGHSFLHRKHNSEKIENDIPKSLMFPIAMNHWGGSLNYRREYYVDELFGENVPIPEWQPDHGF